MQSLISSYRGGYHPKKLLAGIVLVLSVQLSFQSAVYSHGIYDIDEPDTEEVLLSFRYQDVGQVYVSVLVEAQSGSMYLPVSELFSLLGINHNINTSEFTIEGFYLHPDNPYSLDFRQHSGVFKEVNFQFDQSELFKTGELDYFLAPEVFEKLFGLEFIINKNTLTLTLQTDDLLPVVAQSRRNRNRRHMAGQPMIREAYPLLHGRRRSVITAGFLDYSFSTINTFTHDQNNYNYSFVGGAELLGGDIQGAHAGSYTPSGDWMHRTRNLRWRYVIRENPFISQIYAGQIRTNGLQSRSVRGVSLSNDPVEPRQLQGSQIIEGTTEPDSEVELYVNNMLAGYAIADGLGTYRFEVPLRYGTSRLQTRIYTPNGQTFMDEQRIRTPFHFLPPGVVTYNLEGGVIESENFRYYTDAQMLHGNVSVGLTNRITAQTGIEYIDGTNERPFMYGSLSGRVFGQYLMSVDVAPDAFYRFQSSVIYPSSRSITAGYTHFTGPSLYNTRYADQLIEATMYTPVQLGRFRAGIRMGGEHIVFPDRNQTRYTGDLYLRMGRVSLRFNYRDDIYNYGDTTWYGTGQLRGSATYALSKNGRIPSILRGSYLRLTAMYERSNRHLRYTDVQLSRSILNNGRIYTGVHHDFHTGLTRMQAGISIDFGGRVRSATDFRSQRDNQSIRQNFRGSVGLDERSGQLVLSPREQAGRSAASVILFIDNNNSGTFDEGDEILPHSAVKVDRLSVMNVGRDGVLRLSQLQSYYKYNLVIDRNAIPNPLLVPAVENFSFIADPNQYKRIEIPFYRSGVIDGTVSILRNGEYKKQGGLRVLLNGLDHEFSEVIRTFHNGGFYAMDIPPGRYTVEVDPVQLNLLGAVQRDGIAEIEIRHLAQGDFVEDIKIVLVPVVGRDVGE